MATKDANSGRFHDKNDEMRIDVFDKLDEAVRVAVVTFFRKTGHAHLFEEWLAPTLKGGEAAVVVAVRDRAWPPWGIGAQNIEALCEIYPAGERTYALTPVFTTNENGSNIGLITAVYKEAL